MKRRALLGRLGIVSTACFAGCIGAPSQGTQSKPTPASRITSSSQDTIPHQFSFDITVKVIHSQFTEDQPGIIQITTTNNGDPVSLSVGSGYCSIFNRTKGGSDDPSGLWLHRPETAKNINRKEGQWVADKSSDEPRGSANAGCMMQTYEKGQSITSTYQVWDDYQTEGYLESGTYRWETDVSISDASSDRESSEESILWGFSLTLEE